MKYYRGKTILLTGAYGGFGRHFIIELLKSGAKIILTDIEVKNVDKIFHGDEEKLLPEDWKKGIIASIPSDLSTSEGCKNLYGACKKLGMEIDIIIHNAGIVYVGTFLDIPEELCEKNISVNLLSIMRLNKLFLPDMVRRKAGHLIYLSSIAGIVATPYAVPYTVTKFGVRALAMSIHGELKRYGIKTSIVYPFFSKTPIIKYQVFGNPKMRTMPDFFLAEPDDVARRALKGAARGKLHVPTCFFSRFMWYAVRFWPIIAEQQKVRDDMVIE
jgi:short-subunit dehydrogenase